ncbi:MAG: tetratricopeptide repeat protein [Deltaproteobacteria bacterium]|nr:tetratricopeptide repeat protein [Deltaproteobacteria bacterium]
MLRSKLYPTAFLFLTSILASTLFPHSAPAGCKEDLSSAVPGGGAARGDIVRVPEGDTFLSAMLLRISARAGRDLTGRDASVGAAQKEFGRLALRVHAYTMGTRDGRRTVAALNRVLFEEEGFVYDSAPGDPENYLIDRVLARKRGNCLGMTVIYLALAERLGIPLGGVYVPSHCFVRCEGSGVRINIETGEKGAERSDEWYAGKFRIGKGRPYLRTLGKGEMIGVYLKSLGAAYSRRGLEEEALRLYREAALVSPSLPDVYFNAGVSYQKMGKVEEAIAQYRRALAVDPDMAPARGNLAAAYCNCGRMEEGIREFRKTLDINPDDARSRAGLAKAYFARGAYREAVEQSDRAIKQGYCFEPSMLEILKRYRLPVETTSLP